MGLFSSLKSIRANGKNFKEWEKATADKDAQREELAKKKPLSTQELERAKKQGKILVDVVDIMDTHSEDVAEKVETATQIPEQLIPGLVALGTTVPVLKQFSKLETNYYKDVRNFLDTPENKKIISELTNKIKNSEHDYGAEYLIEKLIRTNPKKLNLEKYKSEFANIDSIKDDIAGLAEDFAKKVNTPKNKIIALAAIPVVATIAAFVGGTIFATKLQVNSSRVARWQSREQLNDPKYFVQYTDEQIAEAKKNLEAKNANEPKGFFSKLKKNKEDRASIIKVMKDNKAYKEWKKTDVDDSKKVERQLAGDDLVNAQKDQEVIQRVTKAINNKAEDYSENMETAAGVIMGATPVLSAAVASPLIWLMNKVGLGDKISDGVVNSFIKSRDAKDKETLTAAWKKVQDLKGQKSSFEKVRASSDLLSSIFESKPAKSEGVKALGMLDNVKKYAATAFSSKMGRNFIIGGAAAMAASIVGIITGLKLQKSAARAGRYTAKREIEQNPQNFVGYTENDYKEVAEIKAKPKTAGAKFKEYITFLPRVMGEYIQYSKFKKTEGKENKELLDELVKLNVNETQLKDAKDAQRKIFNTFEKVDEGSQEYSESMEAFTTIAQPAVMYAGLATTILTPTLLIANAARKGKLKTGAILESVSGFFAKHTKFLKGKFAKNYTNDIANGISNKVRHMPKDFYGNDMHLKMISELVENFEKDGAKSLTGGLGISLSELKKMLKTEDWKKIVQEFSDDAPGHIRKLGLSEMDNKQLLKIIDNFEKLGANIPKEQLNKIMQVAIAEFKQNPEQFMNLMNNPTQLKMLFLTKGVKIAAGAATATWAAVNFAAVFAVESYLASLQKKAGRLGVMKGLEQLQDPAYYANSEPSMQAVKSPETQSEKPQVSSALAEYMKNLT